MPIFVSHVTLTPEGVQAIKDVPARIEENRKLWAEAGGKLLHWYIVLGDYDYLLISDAPNERSWPRLRRKHPGAGAPSFRPTSPFLSKSSRTWRNDCSGRWRSSVRVAFDHSS